MISPFAVFQNNGTALTEHPFSFENVKDKIASILNQRMSFLMYMRTNLYQISQDGGALVRPLIADYPEKNFSSKNVDSVLFGNSIKVDLVFEQEDDTKDVLLFDSWLDLRTFKKYQSLDKITTTKMQFTGESVIMMQKEGTIIPIQNSTKYQMKTTNDIKNTPITLSIFLTHDNQRAAGNIFVEDG